MGSFFCALCENALEEVRPGKFQCPYCEGEGEGGWNLTTIERAANGWIVRYNDGESTQTTVFDHDARSEVQCFAAMLRFLTDKFMPGSRHDAERVYVEVRPGDKWEGR